MQFSAFSPARLLSIICSLICCISFAAQASKGLPDSQVHDGGFNVGSHSRDFRSNINGRDYKLYVNLPSGYNENTSSNYPVLFVLDAQWYFTNLVSTYGSMNYDGLVPDIIIVGVTWGGEKPNYSLLRKQDMDTPEYEEGAGLFLKVLKDEIVPLVDQEYRTNGVDRALTGGSLSGFYTFYAMFNAPSLFNGFIVWNPTLFWHNKLAFKFEQEYAKKHEALDARVYVVVADNDATLPWIKMREQLRAHDYQKLELKSDIVSGLAHSSARIHAHAHGMAHVYQREYVTLPKKELKQYEGTYLLENQPTLSLQDRSVFIESNGKHLVIKNLLGNEKLPLFPLGEGKFAFQGGHLDLVFKQDKKEKNAAFRVEMGKGNFISAVKGNASQHKKVSQR